MARPLRIEYDDAVYHVTSRGNDRKAIFRDDEDKTAFLNILGATVEKYNLLCHAFCLMTNHYHLVIETPDANLSVAMRHLNGVFTQTSNRRHRRSGHLLQGRYSAVVVQKESHLLEAVRYTLLNPVRAKMVADSADWPWSSFRMTVGSEAPLPLLTRGLILGMFGRTKANARAEFAKFVREPIGVKPIGVRS